MMITGAVSGRDGLPSPSCTTAERRTADATERSARVIAFPEMTSTWPVQVLDGAVRHHLHHVIGAPSQPLGATSGVSSMLTS